MASQNTNNRRFQPGYIYPLTAEEADRWDDDLGTGYDHAVVPTGSDPGACTIIDMWPANAAGEFHPGYDGAAVPVRIDDVQIDAGRPFEGTTPEPKGGFWR